MDTQQRRTARNGQERCPLTQPNFNLPIILKWPPKKKHDMFQRSNIQVCTISKETKRKFNPVTKCEKVRVISYVTKMLSYHFFLILYSAELWWPFSKKIAICSNFRFHKHSADHLGAASFPVLRFAMMR